ncbi:ammonium transporter [Pirellula staleyi DSM 6068]|uniref:Ammonium transporter n=1 Tax=Pirellula staleyi (strain ATCC 27377 / DSM 6068 / ICPB 4128) TaxID=530564 RepID=D2R647_PIRSD|nr:ammonium transporter [Pirellula staleyi]ADB19132.1 ammonium transporter [Pirellula staleyi DSM 6068]
MSRSSFSWAGMFLALLLCTSFAVTAYGQEATPPAETPAAEAPAETPAEPAAETPAAETPAEPAAEEAAPAAPLAAAYGGNEIEYAFDNFILFICAVLVLFMQAGFALVETGLNASKNAVNIMFKNFMDMCIGAVLYFICGYGIMYPGDAWIVGEYFGFAGWGIGAETGDPVAANLTSDFDFLFQAAFAATAATIVSGSVAGRIKFPAYLIYTVIISAVIYPISGSWKWGYGWLHDKGFVDFAGSVVVHSVGGLAGLAGAIALGPRIGKFINGKAQAMPGHNIPYVALGVFILVIGWFGFNPGSQLAFVGKANVDLVAKVAVNTLLAGCFGGVVSMIFSWGLFKKPDLTMALNGTLAGLVAVTANCHIITYGESFIISGVAGVLVVLGIVLLDKVGVDDPVGAFPVHGICGMWAGVATGIFGDLAEGVTRTDFIVIQVIGTAVIGVWALGTSLVMFFAMKACGVLRVDAEEEILGLDITEHGMYAYPQGIVSLEHTPGSSGMHSVGMSGSTVPAGKPSTEAV